MYTPLPTNFDPGKSYAMEGELINRLSQAVNAANAVLSQSGLAGFSSPGMKAIVGDRPFQIGLIEITSVSNECKSVSNGGFEENAPPCAKLGKFGGKLRWWRTQDQKWVTEEDELAIDTGAYTIAFEYSAYESQEANVKERTLAPVLLVGDVIPGYFDPARGILVAIFPPRHSILGKTNTAITKGQDGKVTVWTTTADSEDKEVPTKEIVTVRNLMVTVGLNKWVAATRMWNGKYYLTAAECPLV